MISPDLKALLAKALPKVSDRKELVLFEFCDEILAKISNNTQLDSHHIGEALSFLHKKGLISYRESYTQYGMRFIYKRSATEEQIKEILGDGDQFQLVDAENPEKRKRGRPKKQKYYEVGILKRSEIKKEEEKPKDCCDHPKIVRNKKTGKRRCKNCGFKYPNKKIKGCCLNPKIVKNKKTGKRRCKNCDFQYPPKKKKT